ncbi:hypothetical protein [Actinokineospora sp.]|uniref:hypothetical protein n=1 Tax=Actinokineospora sp. TaxID=1872133 RepID=UPI003D6AEA77
MNTPDDALQALTARGFRYIQTPGYALDGGCIPWTLLFIFGWEAPYVDAVHVRGADDVTAFRAHVDDTGASTAAESVVWKCEGDIVEAVAELLALPAPDEPGAPTRVIRTPSSLWTPGDGVSLPDIFSFL